MSQIVYVLTNPCFPDLIKIGLTSDLKRRVRELSASTSIPLPFQCYYACEVSDSAIAEKSPHFAFDDHRVSPRREFFRLDPEKVVAILRLVQLREVTMDDDEFSNHEEDVAVEREVARQSAFKFTYAQIPPGAEIFFTRYPQYTATVVDDRAINFEGQTTSLTAATKIILERERGLKDGSVAGPRYWSFEGEMIVDRRNRLEQS